MKRNDDERNDIFDRTYIGRPGCMAIVVLVGILYIIYNIYSNS